MPELKCTVQTCVHNQQFLCNLDKIEVGGNKAKRSEETCCDSFQERKGDSYSIVTGTASPTSTIDCKATDCQYNECATFCAVCEQSEKSGRKGIVRYKRSGGAFSQCERIDAWYGRGYNDFI